MSLPIGPETTVGAMLEAYPELEGVLLEMAPSFAKLRNPVVRRTVAKVANLEQAAKIGGISLQAMILRLRNVTGQSVPDLPVLQPRQDAVGDDASWLLDPAYSGLAGTRRRPCLYSRRVIFGGLSLTSLLVR